MPYLAENPIKIGWLVSSRDTSRDFFFLLTGYISKSSLQVLTHFAWSHHTCRFWKSIYWPEKIYSSLNKNTIAKTKQIHFRSHTFIKCMIVQCAPYLLIHWSSAPWSFTLELRLSKNASTGWWKWPIYWVTFFSVFYKYKQALDLLRNTELLRAC